MFATVRVLGQAICLAGRLKTLLSVEIRQHQ